MASCLAYKGYMVIGVDVDVSKIKEISFGRPPFYEPRLREMLSVALGRKLFSCTNNYQHAIDNSDISFITVGTPSKADGSIDLTYVKEASKGIGEALRSKEGFHVVVVKSTVTPGTTKNVVKPIIEDSSGKRCGVGFGLCVNPEFLREGSAVHDFLNPDRIIIGGCDGRSSVILEDFYRKLYGRRMPKVIRTNPSAAELVKYANNAFLAMKISFINTLANICGKVEGADVSIIAKGIGLDKRIGPLFLKAGIGYGGSCLPKDIKALISFSKQLGYKPKLLEAADVVNEEQPLKAFSMAKEELGELKGKRVAVLGLAFKAETDDMREAPSIKIINALISEGASVVAYDPKAMDTAKKIFKESISYAPTSLNCIKGCDCCIIATDWSEFKKLKPKEFVENMRTPLVIDGRRIFNPSKFSKVLKYRAIGYNNLQ